MKMEVNHFNRKEDVSQMEDPYVQPIYQALNQTDKPKEQREEFVKEWLQHYDTATGSKPKSFHLQLLADVMLQDELKDRNCYKMTHNEYPILSRWQQQYRYRKEYSIKLAEEYAADGKWYKKNIS
ncbi:hypothetical protein [Bacillus horti]|uniref:Uncharacterized protein n=1 Tax=Caldalkalibacillus horti TaxID=77523 RepID=A0ABT9W083_9BACI|nr:hypothetical protein [Bacillus horti]MDQ0166632.1 hypothetical protein [Bacillus horti]